MNLPNTSILTPLPEDPFCGDRRVLYLREMLESDAMKASKAKMPIPLGMDENGDFVIGDLSLITHMLIAGSTATGKSVLLHSVLASLLMQYGPEELKLCLIDPKQVELTEFEELPHLYAPIAKRISDGVTLLKELCELMEARFAELESKQKWNIRQIGLPPVVVIIDELADLIRFEREAVETALVRLLQKSRAVGIHLIMTTQNASDDVITELLQENIHTQLSFHVPTAVESKLILGCNGAERLSNRADALLHLIGETDLIHLQTPYIGFADAERITEYWKHNAK